MATNIPGITANNRPGDQSREKSQRTGTDGTRTYVVATSADGGFPLDVLPASVQVQIYRKLDIPDAVNAGMITKTIRKNAIHSQVWQLNASSIGFPMACIPTPTSARLKNLLRELREKAAHKVNLTNDILEILGTDTPTLGQIRHLAANLGVTLDQTDYELMKSYVIDLRKMAARVEDRPADITQLLENEVLTIAQINHLQEWIKARATLIWLLGDRFKFRELDDHIKSDSTALIKFARSKECEVLALKDKDYDVLEYYNENLIIIPEEIGFGNSFEYICLGYNNLTELPTAMNQLTKVVDLELYGNCFISVPEVIASFSNLKLLDLRWNPLTSLPKWLWDLPNLDRILLDPHLLQSIPMDILKSFHVVYIPNVCLALLASQEALKNFTENDLPELYDYEIEEE